MKKQKLTIEQFECLPDFLRVELIDGEVYTDDWTGLIIDESVFAEGAPSADHHVSYKLIVNREQR